jgi:hypothetical protein
MIIGLCESSTLAASERASIAVGVTGTFMTDATEGAELVATESVHAPRFTPRIITKTVPMNFERNMHL